MQPHDPSQMRVSDDDRHQVAEALREAAAQGRLDLDEFDERLGAAYAAKVYADLLPLTMDLPAADRALQPLAGPQPLVPASVPSPGSSVAMMSAVDRKGVWRVPAAHSAFAMMGSVTIDLRQAVFSAPETIITANAVMGEVSVYVNAGTHVVVEGTGFMGDFSQTRDRVPPEFAPGAPVVRVKGVAFMGAVSVTRKRMPGEPGGLKKLLGG